MYNEWLVVLVSSLHLTPLCSQQVAQKFWLAVWSSHTEDVGDLNGDPQQGRYIAIYFGIGFASIFFGLMGSMCLLIGTMNASRTLLIGLVRKVVHLPMSFFDTQPSGRLINRYSTCVMFRVFCQHFDVPYDPTVRFAKFFHA